MNGRRIPDSPTGEGVSYQPGDYGRIAGTWYGVTPNGMLASLNNHAVTEHEDGTITVSPSILTHGPFSDGPSWHGFLVRGEWRDA